MKILCLHGSGTSADIFAAQTAMVRENLDPDEHTFHFLDAPHLWYAGPGVLPFFDGPFYAWWTDQTTDNVKVAAKKLLLRLQAQHPPYDAVLCFSQGCSLLASLIFYFQAEFPNKPVPFRSVIFICGGVPLYVLNTWIEVSEQAKAIEMHNIQQVHAASHDAPRKVAAYMASGVRQRMWDRPTALWDGQEDSKSPCRGMPSLDASNVFGLDLSSLPSNLRIDIPSLHIYGHKDPICTCSLQLAIMSNAEKRLVYDHGGGHEIPFNGHVAKDIANAIQWLEKWLDDDVMDQF
ncbi:hypothetical protein KCU78_g723, partial [Aureobasidium melanogenum]